MLRIPEHDNLEEASKELLGFATLPQNWVALDSLVGTTALRPTDGNEYQRTVGPLRVCATVEVDGKLEARLHIAFKAPGLTPIKASDHLAEFVRAWIPLIPNSEWQVEADGPWVHFRRRYAGPSLAA